MLIVMMLIFFPALQSMVRTLFDENGNLSLARYTDFFQDPISVSNLSFTFQITLITVAILFVVCFPLALYLRFSNSRLSNWVQTLALFPLFVPGIILAYALIRFFTTRGTLETMLNIAGLSGYRTPYLKPAGIIIGLVWESIPFTVLILSAGLRQVDDALIESARDVGANNVQIFTRILLPLIQRPALIVFTLNFIGIFGSYTIPYLLGPAAPQMMGVYMQRTFSEFRLPDAAQTQAVITCLMSALVGLLYVRTISKQRAER